MAVYFDFLYPNAVWHDLWGTIQGLLKTLLSYTDRFLHMYMAGRGGGVGPNAYSYSGSKRKTINIFAAVLYRPARFRVIMTYNNAQ